MRNIFLFIRRYFNFLLFLVLQVLSIYIIVHYNAYHEAAFGNTANRITGSVNKRYNGIQNYFKLRQTNDSLVAANELLYNKLKLDYNFADAVSKTVIDTLKVDSVVQYRSIEYLGSKVIANSVSAQNNYLVLFGTNIPKYKSGVGVVDANNNVVGVVTEVSGNYAVVMSLLHKDSRLSAKLYKGGETGTLIWDGNTPGLLTLTAISKSAKIAVGDSVITSGFSTIFPRGLLVGRVHQLFKETATNNYRIVVKSAANFENIQYAYGIINIHQNAVKSLLDKTKQAVQ